MVAKLPRQKQVPNPGVPEFDPDGFLIKAGERVAEHGFTHPARTLKGIRRPR